MALPNSLFRNIEDNSTLPQPGNIVPKSFTVRTHVKVCQSNGENGETLIIVVAPIGHAPTTTELEEIREFQKFGSNARFCILNVSRNAQGIIDAKYQIADKIKNTKSTILALVITPGLNQMCASFVNTIKPSHHTMRIIVLD